MRDQILTLSLLKWCEWDTEKTDRVVPPLDFVEPMVRRRLSPLAKMSLWVAHQCAHDVPGVRMVYASQHGEIHRTVEMLVDLADQSQPSPTAFSMSVLNASIGLYSIIQGNTAPATAISAGEDTFACGLIEAWGQLSMHPEATVLLIYADDPIPEALVPGARIQPGSHALALLFGAGGERSIAMTQGTGGENSRLSQARIFAQGLLAGGESSWQMHDKAWRWRFT